MGLCSSSNVKYRTSNPAHEITCPDGALRVQPGLNSFSKAVKEAKEKNIDCLFLLSGMHDEKGESVKIDFALKVVGQNRDDVKIKAGLWIEGKKEEDVFFSDCTVTGAKRFFGILSQTKNDGHGVYGVGCTSCAAAMDALYHGVDKSCPDCGGSGAAYGVEGAAVHLKNVCVENCGRCGVSVGSNPRNTMTDCNVNNNKESGVFVNGGGCMTIGGSATTIHDNCTGGDSRHYGLIAHGSSSIHLQSLPHYASKNIQDNGGGGDQNNFNGGVKNILTTW